MERYYIRQVTFKREDKDYSFLLYNFGYEYLGFVPFVGHAYIFKDNDEENYKIRNGIYRISKKNFDNWIGLNAIIKDTPQQLQNIHSLPSFMDQNEVKFCIKGNVVFPVFYYLKTCHYEQYRTFTKLHTSNRCTSGAKFCSEDTNTIVHDLLDEEIPKKFIKTLSLKYAKSVT